MYFRMHSGTSAKVHIIFQWRIELVYSGNCTKIKIILTYGGGGFVSPTSPLDPSALYNVYTLADWVSFWEGERGKIIGNEKKTKSLQCITYTVNLQTGGGPLGHKSLCRTADLTQTVTTGK